MQSLARFTVLLTIPLFTMMLGWTSSCDKSDTPDSGLSDNQRVQEASAEDFPRYWNDLARYLGGLPPEPDSLFAEQSSQKAFLNHQNYFNKSWKSEAGRLQKLRTWRDVQLSDANASGRRVFYPFSGPDFLNIYAFYPDAPRYFMFGLEKPGSLIDLRTLSAGNQAAYLQNLQVSLKAILSWSFFRTKAMKVNFNNQVMDGLHPVILAFMARHGVRILDVMHVRIKDDGKLYAIYRGPVEYTVRDLPDYHQPITITDSPHEVQHKEKINPKSKKSPYTKTKSKYAEVPGIRIRFQKPGEDTVRDVIFFSFNVANDGLRRHGQFERFVKDNCPCNTYLKAASYLMHAPGFTKIRSIVQDNSDFLLQDDSGIPVRYFKRSDWDLTFYGVYREPIRLFKGRVQPDLQRIYRGKDVQPLPFGVGYKYREGTSNLMRARKKSANKKDSTGEAQSNDSIKDSMAVGREEKQSLPESKSQTQDRKGGVDDIKLPRVEASPESENRKSTTQPGDDPANRLKYGSL